jgi:hypothetical protein
VKVLIDECLDERLRLLLANHDCETGFDVLITADQSMSHQQNFASRRIAVVILCGRTNRLADIAPIVPIAMRKIARIRPGEIVSVGT